jgi:hypothetical protein
MSVECKIRDFTMTYDEVGTGTGPGFNSRAPTNL